MPDSDDHHARSPVQPKLSRLRRLFPPHGQAYELFDCAVLVLVLSTTLYVLTAPSEATDKALAAPFDKASAMAWGGTLAAVALAAVTLSYTRHLKWGYVVLVVALGFWSLSFLIGAVHLLKSGEWVAGVRAIGSVFLYAWIARRLMREVKISAGVVG